MFRVLFAEPQTDSTAPSPAPVAAEDDELAIRYAGTVDEALAQARTSDMILVSASLLPEGRALEIVSAVAEARPGIHILVKDLAASGQSPLKYIDAGATGWLL